MKNPFKTSNRKQLGLLLWLLAFFIIVAGLIATLPARAQLTAQWSKPVGGCVTGCTFTGNTTVTQLTLTNVALTDAASIAWNTAQGNVATVTLTASGHAFAAPSNLTVGNYVLHVIQGGAGTNLATWNAVFKWASGIAPTLSTVVGAHDIVSCTSDGTNLYCGFIGDVK